MTFKSRHSKMNVPEIVRQRKKEKLTGQDTAYIALDISVTSHTHTHTHTDRQTQMPLIHRATYSCGNTVYYWYSTSVATTWSKHNAPELTQRTASTMPLEVSTTPA